MNALSIDNNSAFFKRFYALMPNDVARSFTDTQLKAISAAFSMRRWRDHSVELRWIIPLLGHHYYFILLSGGERRSQERRLKDRLLNPLLALGNGIFAIVLFSAILISVLITLYVLKSVLGINLLPGFSFGIMPIFEEEWKMLFE